MVSAEALGTPELDRARRRRELAVVGLLLCVAAVLGPLVGMLVIGGHPLEALFAIGLMAPLLFWWVRSASVILLVLAATGFMRFFDPGADAVTAKVPLFRSFSETYGVSGAIVLPIEMLIAVALLVWIAKAIASRRVAARPTQLGVAVATFVVVALLAEVLGLARSGVFNISLWELRPFLYVGLTYVLASQSLTTLRSLGAVLWAMVIGTGTMAILGAERTITTFHVYPRPAAVLEHDEAFFFGCFVLLTVALWVYSQRGWLRRVATAFLPLVVIADFGNNRRSAWAILPAILLALAVIAYTCMPQRRKRIAWVAAVLLLLGTGYVFAFRFSSSLIGEPAHAIWSQFRPDERDFQSNLYRQLENLNLGLDIRSSPVFGEGFGVPLEHPIPLFDISGIDPLINFIPHNTIFYVWLRMGSIGAAAFWFLVGAAIVAACRLARQKDAFYGLLGTLVVAEVIAWLIEGWFDKGIVSFRITIMVGCMLGALQAARKLSLAAARHEDDERRSGQLVKLRPEGPRAAA